MLGKIGKEKRRGGEDRLKVKQRGVAFGVVEEGVSGADVFRVLGFPEDDSKRQIAVGAFALQILVRERPADPLLSAKGIDASRFLALSGAPRFFPAWRQAIFPVWGTGKRGPLGATENKRRTRGAGRLKQDEQS